MPRLVIVTATTNPARALSCFRSWGDAPIVAVANNCDPFSPPFPWLGAAPISWLSSATYLGTVPAFRRGVDFALAHTDAEVIACLHDDVELFAGDWAERVLRHFDRQPACGLAGFGGAIGLGDSAIYQKPYDPMQLARVGFRSNMRDAELHGVRSLLTEQVACLDGFSQIGRREFWEGALADGHDDDRSVDFDNSGLARPWTALEALGVMHHFYDGMLGCLAKRYGWETWYLPSGCHHYGGRTAVGDQNYQAWAKTQCEGGDHGFWEAAHRIGYEQFRDVLPLRV
jgi:hypothetical protein